MNEETQSIYDQLIRATRRIQVQNAVEENLILYRLDTNNNIIAVSAKEFFEAKEY